jgi:hypothetical protein
MKRGLLYINNRFFVRIALKYQDEFVGYVIPKYPPKFTRDHGISLEDEFHELKFVHVGQGYYHTHVSDEIAVKAFPVTCAHPGCLVTSPNKYHPSAGKFLCQEHFFEECG